MSLFLRTIYLSSALSLLYIFALYRSHPLRRMPIVSSMSAFVIGMVAVIPVVVLRRVIPVGIPESTWTAHVVTAVLEEGAKLGFFAVTLWRLGFPNLVEPIDVAIYFGILGVGFGVYEDFWYIFSASYPSWIAGDQGRFREVFRLTVVARAFPGHVLFNGLAGFLLGWGTFRSCGWRRAGWVALGFLAAVAAHTAFNGVATVGGEIPLLTLVLAYVGLFLEFRRRALRVSPFTALISYVEGRIDSWPLRRNPIDLLFAEGFSWPGKPGGGLFQFYPLILSLTILFPFLVACVYLLHRVVSLPLGT